MLRVLYLGMYDGSVSVVSGFCEALSEEDLYDENEDDKAGKEARRAAG